MLADLKNNLQLQYIYFILASNIRAKFIFSERTGFNQVQISLSGNVTMLPFPPGGAQNLCFERQKEHRT